MGPRHVQLCAVATQSAAVRFICPFLSMSSVGNKTLAQLGFSTRGELVSVKATAPILDALQLLTDRQVICVSPHSQTPLCIYPDIHVGLYLALGDGCTSG